MTASLVQLRKVRLNQPCDIAAEQPDMVLVTFIRLNLSIWQPMHFLASP